MSTVSSLQSTSAASPGLRDVSAADAGGPAAWLRDSVEAGDRSTLQVGAAQQVQDLEQLERDFMAALCENDAQRSGL